MTYEVKIQQSFLDKMTERQEIKLRQQLPIKPVGKHDVFSVYELLHENNLLKQIDAKTIKKN